MARGKKPIAIELGMEEKEILAKIVKSRTIGTDAKERARIVLTASEGMSNKEISEQYGLETHRISRWRKRWREMHDRWLMEDAKSRPKMTQSLVLQWFRDGKGRGRKATITEEQWNLILSVACEPPSKSGWPHTHWTDRLLAAEVIRRGIVEYISHISIWRFLKEPRPEAAQKPILSQHHD